MNEIPFVKGSDTSEAAAAEMVSSAKVVREKVLDFITSSPNGATCDEIEMGLNLKHQTASARVWELRKAGLVRDSKVRRLTRSGRAAAVMVPGAEDPQEEVVIDYRALLVKYLQHIGEIEGYTYLGSRLRSDVRFTDEEWAELERLDQESAEAVS